MQRSGLTLAMLFIALQIFLTGIGAASATASLNNVSDFTCLTKDAQPADVGNEQPTRLVHHHELSCCILHYGNLFFPNAASPKLPNLAFHFNNNALYTAPDKDFLPKSPERRSLSPRAPPSQA